MAAEASPSRRGARVRFRRSATVPSRQSEQARRTPAAAEPHGSRSKFVDRHDLANGTVVDRQDDAAEIDEPVDTAAEAPALFTIAAAARWLGISKASVYRGLHSGHIPVSPIVLGNTQYLARRHLEAWLAEPPIAPVATIAASDERVRSRSLYGDLDDLFVSGRART